MRGREVELVSIPQCAFGGSYQKWTTLLAEGLLASRMGALRGLQCGHTHREVRAIGINVDGACRAGEAAEYPVLFSASIACLLSQECDGMTAGVLRCALASPEAAALRDSVASDEVDRGDITIGSRAGKDGCFGGTATGVRGGATSSWKYSWEAMPQAWDEREDVIGERASTEGAGGRATYARYVSRRRAEAEQ